MSALTIVVMILQVICAVALIAIVTLQSSKDSGLSGAIGGGSDSFFGKGKSKSRDAILASATKWVATAFIVLTFLLSLI